MCSTIHVQNSSVYVCLDKLGWLKRLMSIMLGQMYSGDEMESKVETEICGLKIFIERFSIHLSGH